MTLQKEIEKSKRFKEKYVNFIIQNNTIPTLTLGQIKAESKKDKMPQQVLEKLEKGENGEKMDKDILYYRGIKTDLFDKNLMLLKTSSIVLANSSRRKASEIVHKNHRGIARAKQYLSENFFWPTINEDIRSAIVFHFKQIRLKSTLTNSILSSSPCITFPHTQSYRK